MDIYKEIYRLQKDEYLKEFGHKELYDLLDIKDFNKYKAVNANYYTDKWNIAPDPNDLNKLILFVKDDKLDKELLEDPSISQMEYVRLTIYFFSDIDKKHIFKKNETITFFVGEESRDEYFSDLFFVMNPKLIDTDVTKQFFEFFTF